MAFADALKNDAAAAAAAAAAELIHARSALKNAAAAAAAAELIHARTRACARTRAAPRRATR